MEARRRGTTVYLVGQRLDMLPSALSADLCSLHQNRDRFAVSVMWELDVRDNGNVATLTANYEQLF
ncbi:hypothetical protein PsorP6_001496 [Peronosclerospora sorghi]|uniref:Uncharacterized protein n=1 Tax=Peronosclerospora sorghi TaxID=230839 RepID=A0ACC0WRY9_9STRA|nr:hypothetical protein PsorP6_001496 [Peronosclerospora sorghi]